MNWAEMTPRQRDALVAEKVLGWQWYTMEDCNILTDINFYYVGSPYKRGKQGAVDDLSGGGVCQAVPHFTTDIAAAWPVMEYVEGLEISRDENRWCVRYDGAFVVVADTAMEAISLAALRAKGVEV